MKIICILGSILFVTVSIVAQKPSAVIKANKNILILDDEKKMELQLELLS